MVAGMNDLLNGWRFAGGFMLLLRLLFLQGLLISKELGDTSVAVGDRGRWSLKS